jgi:hypothetical protein
MKVVCIKIPPTFATIKLEVGEIFVSFESRYGTTVQSNINKNVDKYWYVTDRLGNVIPCDFEVGKYFITLEEWRKKQLDKIL